MDPTTRPSRLTRRRPVPATDPDLTRPPQPVAPSAWMLPDPAEADIDGVVGIGADLAPGTLVDAYSRGMFPWPHSGVPLPWFSPDPRGVVFFERLHVSRSLRRRLRACGWTTTVDRAFADVVAACGEERGDAGTWITAEMARAYGRLNDLGHAHSLEVWDGTRLVGGVYGVQVGGVFTGESMFHRVADASKAALVDLVHRFRTAGGTILDVQLTTTHLRSLGAVDAPRPDFLEILERCRRHDVRMRTPRREVARLAGPSERDH